MAQISASFPPEVIEEVNKEKSKEPRETTFSSMVLILVEEALDARKKKKK